MSQGHLMGLDLGGGGIRCLLVDLATGESAFATRAWTAHPVTDVPASAEYDADATWRVLAEVAREALARSGAERVLGIAAAGMRHGSAVLDADGHEVFVASNRDARGAATAMELAGSRGAALHRETGHWPNAVQPACRLRWLVTERPDLLERSALHLSLSDWIAFRLCGERVTEASQASETGLLRIAEREWAWNLVDSLELPRTLLPELRAPGTRLGGLTPAAAEALGLPAGTPVSVGGADTQCALLGAGVVAPGDLGLVAGSTAPLLQVQDQPVLDDAGRLWAVHHVVPGHWALEGNAGALGESLEWLAGLLHPDADHPMLQILAEAGAAPPGSAGLVSTFGADVMDARQMALPVGNLTLNQTTTAADRGARRHLSRSVVEGMAFAVRGNAEQIAEATGIESETLRASGGLARSAFFTQLLADALARPVEVSGDTGSTALGAAICAGVGAGALESLEQGAHRLVRVTRTHTPDATSRSVYADLYPGWRSLRDEQATANARASGFAIRALLTGGAAADAGPRDFRPRILVTADLDEEALEALREFGDVEHASYREAMRLLTGPSLVKALRGVHVFVSEIDVIDARALLEAKDLRVVGVCRGDAVNVDLEACAALGIPVFHTPGRNADAVADLTLTFLLALARRLPAANAFLREPGGAAGDMGRMGRAFGTLRGRELWHKTVGLVGLGAVGRKVVERLRPFGARCRVYDPFLEPDAVRLAGAEPVELDALLAESDFVSLHAAVTDASRGLIGARELGLMREGACLVNTARAVLVDEDALTDALRSGHLGGAALDVFSVEPPAWDAPLLQFENVIATPHVGGNTFEVGAHQGRIVAEEIGRLARGAPLRHALGPGTPRDFDWSRPRPEPAPDLAERLAGTTAPAVTDLERDAKSHHGAVRRATREAPEPHEPETGPGEGGGEVQEIRDAMERVLTAFVERARGDAKLGAFAAGSDPVTLHFSLPDLGTDFHLGFRDGAVVAELGAPPDAGDVVKLEMRADLFDGMLTGRSNAMQAAMNGELSFSGDTAKAMTLQQINPDMSRLYREALEEAGDPGDLAALPDPNAARRAAAAPAGGAVDDVRGEICRVIDDLYAAQLITATGGNVSARVPGAPDEAWITPSQLFKGSLGPEILVRIGMDGKALEAGARSPSSEALMHTAVLEAKPEAQAVIHCHAPNATILVNSDLPFLPVSTEAAFFVDIGRIPFVMPGTRELADAVVAAMGDGWAVLMQNHGLLVAGRTLRRAADMAEIIERTAQVILGCHAVGKPPPVLPDEVVDMLSKYGDLMA